MITFGYNSRFSAPLRAMLFIALGVLMILAKADAMELVVKVVAAFVLATGLVSFFLGYKKRSDGTMPLAAAGAVTNIVIAVLLFVFSKGVAGFISYLLGFVLLGFGIFQISVLASVRKSVKVGFGAYVIPLVVALVGLFIIIWPKALGQSIGLVAGIALIAYGISEFIAAFKVSSATDPDKITPAPAQDDPAPSVPDAKDVDYEKVDEQ